MLAERLLALTALAGRMVVVAAATDEWETARHGFARLLGRGDAEQTRLTERRLEETRDELTGSAPSAGPIRTTLAAQWAGQLAELLEENPDAEAELRELVREIQAVPNAEVGSASSHTASANGVATTSAAAEPAPEHPDALAAQSELAFSVGLAGDRGAARDQFAALVPVTERVLGPEHPDTLTNRHNLAKLTGYAGDATAAQHEFAALLPVCERVFGADSPDTLAANFSLAYWTGHAGDAAAARDQFAALLSVRERASGLDHPDTLAAREELAYWTGCAGDAAAARDLFAALLLVRQRLPSSEDAGSQAMGYQLAYWTARAADENPARD